MVRTVSPILFFLLVVCPVVQAADIQVSGPYYVESNDQGDVKRNLGKHDFCALTYVYSGGFNSACTVMKVGDDWVLSAVDPGRPDPWVGESQGCSAQCFTLGKAGETTVQPPPPPPPQAITWDFETGDLSGWTKTGDAFNFQPTYGDNPTGRNRGEPSAHQGQYWIGTFEKRPRPSDPAGQIQGDGPQGTLTSAPFTINTATISFLVGGGCDTNTERVELLVDGQAVLRATGKCHESMERVRWNVSTYTGRTAQVRLVDASGVGWGHLNFDDLRFEAGVTGGPGGVPGLLSENEVTTRVWKFGRADGSVIAARIELLPGGRIGGYSYPNESRWGLEGGKVVFYDSGGRPTCRFESVQQQGGLVVLSGPFLPDKRITHVLTEVGKR